jgi:hypothetical protein
MTAEEFGEWVHRPENTQSGVEMVWLIDPEARTVTVYRPDQGPHLLEEADELTGEDVLPGFRCRVADFFVLPGDQPEQAPKPPRKRRPKGNA